MGGRLRFLGHACSSYTSTGSVLDIMDYGLAKAIWLSNELTAQMLLILHIIALGLLLQRFFDTNTVKLHHMHFITFIHIHKCLLHSCVSSLPSKDVVDNTLHADHCAPPLSSVSPNRSISPVRWQILRCILHLIL